MSAQQSVTVESKRHTIELPAVLLLISLFVALLAAWPLISQPGLLNTRGGGDSPFLLQRLQQLETALRDGHFPVRWMPDANYGYGYPFFNYYAPLSIYIAVAFRFLGFTFVQSIELAQLAGFLFAAWGMFILARRWFATDWAGLLASVAYTVAPFHLVNIYVRGDSLAEFWAMAWYPWIILAVDALFDYEGEKFPYGRLAAVALTYAALIVSHNISALIFSPFLLLYIFLRSVTWRSSRAKAEGSRPYSSPRRVWWALALALLLAFALAAWFFIPALAEQSLIQLEPVTSGFFHYSNHFRGINLIQPELLFDFSVAGGKAFRLGLIQAILTVLGAATLIAASFGRRLVSKSTALFILLSLMVTVFMITPLSRFLWDNLPLLPFTQFPWRFLSVQAFAGALVTAALALLPARRIVVPITVIVLTIGSLAGLRTDHLLLTDDDVTAQRLAEYEWFTGNIGSTVSAEYLPNTVQPRPYTSSWLTNGARQELRALNGEILHASQLESQTDQQTWQINTADSGATIMFPTLYWPGWRAVVDGKPTEIEPASGSGLIMIDLPPGDHFVNLQLGKTTVRWIAELLSLMAILLVLLLLIKARKKPRLTSGTLVTLVFMITGLLLFRLWPHRPLSASNMSWDFAQIGYLHHDEEGVLFDNGAILSTYDYDREVVHAGEEFSITLNLSGADQEEVSLTLGTPAAAWPSFDPAPPTIAQQTQTAAGEHITFNFNLPENAPAGLIVPRLTMEDARPLTPSGKTRGDLFLRPLRLVNSHTDAPNGPELDARALGVRQRDQETLEIQLAWIARKPLSQDYNVSLRLLDPDGYWLSHLDTQPGYGFLPSSGWPTGLEVDDWLAMSLPPDLPENVPLPLVLYLYEVDSGKSVLSRRLGEITLEGEQLIYHQNEPVFDLPADLEPLPVIFGDSIRLLGYEVARNGTELSLTLYWESMSAGQVDYTRFVHLFDPETDTIVAQSDGRPRNDSYPTSQWAAGEIITDTTVFDLSTVPAGSYHLSTGFYRQEGDSLLHLVPVDPDTQISYSSNRVILPDAIDWFDDQN